MLAKYPLPPPTTPVVPMSVRVIPPTTVTFVPLSAHCAMPSSDRLSESWPKFVITFAFDVPDRYVSIASISPIFAAAFDIFSSTWDRMAGVPMFSTPSVPNSTTDTM